MCVRGYVCPYMYVLECLIRILFADFFIAAAVTVFVVAAGCFATYHFKNKFKHIVIFPHYEYLSIFHEK